MRVLSSLTTCIASVAVLVGTVACSADDSNTNLNPAGPPMVRQVFVSERVMVGAVERTRVQMAFGDHPDIPAEDDARDGVTNALALGNKIRIVLDELLDGSTLEEILCADGTFSAIPSGTTPDDVAECAGVDRRDCTAVCTQIDATDNQPVGILDENEDGAPDELRFKEGIVHLTCGGVEMPLVLDGLSKTFWNPSGNQQIPAGTIGIGGLGPAIVLIPEGLRTGSTCELDIDDSVVDKDGFPICAPEGGDINNDCSGGDMSRITFSTQVFALGASAPPEDAEDVSLTQQILLQFNLDVDETTVDGNVTLSQPGLLGPPTIAVEAAQQSVVSFTIECAMQANTEYTIHVESGANGLLEIFGGFLAEDIDITFNTGDLGINGSVCACAEQCASGFCNDGVCCDTACEGECDACSVAEGATENGTCEITTDDTLVCRPEVDPDCDVAETCDGVLAACPVDAFTAVDTECGDGIAEPTCNPDACDGAGVCTDNPVEPDETACTEVSSGDCCAGVCTDTSGSGDMCP